MIAALWGLLVACSDDEALVRHKLRDYTHLIIVEKADGTFDFSGANAGRCTGNVWVEDGGTGIEERCVWMTQELPAESPLQPIAAECDAGEPAACVALADAVHLHFGAPVRKEMFVYGCDRGVAAGCTGAGRMTMKDWRAERRFENRVLAANVFYEIACAKGDLEGCLEKAALRRDGLPGAAPDPVGAFAEVASLCFGGQPMACEDVSGVLRWPAPEGIPSSAVGADAVDLYACVRGVDASCGRLLEAPPGSFPVAWSDEARRRRALREDLSVAYGSPPPIGASN